MVHKKTEDEGVYKMTSDELIDSLAKSKNNLLQSFYITLQEIAVDCELNRAHNMMSTEYKCFKFEEQYETLQKYGETTHISVGPAFKEDDYDDDKMDTGTYSINSSVKRIKVIEITAVKLIGEEKYSTPNKYWYDPANGHVYDHELKYLVGQVSIDDNKIPRKLDKNTYVIDYVNVTVDSDPLF
jgi:hypothetical protein